jgi:transposase
MGGDAMLPPVPRSVPLTEEDRRIFDTLVPPDHYLHRAARVIDFERFRPMMAPCYSLDHGRPALEPVFLLKLEFLQYHDRLSDQQVIDAARVNMAYREFLELSMGARLPDPSSLSYFRGRLGVEVHQQVFDGVVGQAREHGLVQDRLRLKDATHVIADVSFPAKIALVSKTRNRLLNAVGPYDAQWAEGQRVRAELIRRDSAEASQEERLAMRVTHLREILTWVDDFVQQQRATVDWEERSWKRLERIRALAHKVLDDRDHPEAGNALVSLEDPDARFGRHCGTYCGYLVDLTMDADSELITAVTVPVSSGDEANDAAVLIRQEEEAHGNDVEALSADAFLFKGAPLRELTDPQGLNLEVFVPPVPEPHTGHFMPEDFTLDEAGEKVTCPAGQQTSRRNPSPNDTGWIYRFPRAVCACCPLQGKCMEKLPKELGRSIAKNAYAAEYAAARAKATTPEYAAVRREHHKVEHKLNEMVRHHRGRRARYRGRPKVLMQQLMTGIVVNVKRIVRLLCAAPALATA